MAFLYIRGGLVYIINIVVYNVDMSEVSINLNKLIIPKYQDVLDDVLDHGHTHYVLSGGRGSTKSSFTGIAIVLLIMSYPDVHAVCFRQVGNTMQKSIYGQIVWAIYALGMENYFHVPKTISSNITYKPTGQQIMFMGLDDPNKVKSIKLPFGYIGITWFEELDQYAGENALRKVTQSTMRGGQKFWDFRSFNPPISMNNWANEYVESIEMHPEVNEDTLVVRNTYLDVPEDWLGQQFIKEAEVLKELNPQAYEHEYLGVATGTGGNVFYNACDYDMEEKVPVTDEDGVTKWIPLWKTFDKIYSGIDWGFALDPFRLVRCHFDAPRLDLYIFDEYNTIRTRNEDVFNDLYKEKRIIKTTDLVTADSAEPKSIADFKSYGAFIRGAEKGNDSVRYGIKWLQGLRHIYIDKRRCPLTYTEFMSYEYETDKDGNFISAYPDENNHGIDAVRYAMEKFYKRRGN